MSGEVSLGLNAPNPEDQGAQAELWGALRSLARAVACEEGSGEQIPLLVGAGPIPLPPRGGAWTHLAQL